jgi:hypothetical protein
VDVDVVAATCQGAAFMALRPEFDRWALFKYIVYLHGDGMSYLYRGWDVWIGDGIKEQSILLL